MSWKKREKARLAMASYACNHHHRWHMQAAWTNFIFLVAYLVPTLANAMVSVHIFGTILTCINGAG